MAQNRNNYFGIGLVPASTTSNTLPGDLEYLTTDGKIHIRGAAANDAVVQEALAATLINKTLTAPVIATIVNTGTLTLPTTTDTLVARATTDTFTNKTISGATNTLTNIPSSALPANVVYTTGIQTLTQKTLTSPVINSPTVTSLSVDTITGSGTTLPITSSFLQLNNIQIAGSTISDVSGGITLQSSNAAVGIALNATSTAAVQFQKAGTQIARVDTGGIILTSGNSVKFSDASTGSVSIVAPSSVPTAYTITLPSAVPTSNTALTYNGTNYVWAAASGGSSAGNYTVDTFSGTGSQTVFTLSVDPVSKNNTQINISGVTQQKSTYSITGVTLTFSAPPPTGTSNIEVVSGTVALAATAYASSIQTTLAAVGTINISLVSGQQAIEVAGSSAAVTLSATPFGSTAPSDKSVVRLIGRSATNTVTITNNDANFGCVVNGPVTLGLYNSIDFMYVTSVSRWIETARN